MRDTTQISTLRSPSRRRKLAAILSLALTLGFSSAAQGQDDPAPAQAKLDLDALLETLQTVARDPVLIDQALGRLSERARLEKQSKQAELDDINRRLESLGRAGSLLRELIGEAPEAGTPAQPPEPADATHALRAQAPVVVAQNASEFTDEIKLAYRNRFSDEIWPLLHTEQATCLECHDKYTESPLELPEDPGPAFLHLLQDGYFDPENPSSLLAKLTVIDEEKRMPPEPKERWDSGQVDRVRRFVNDLFRARGGIDERADERFPEALAEPFEGRPSRRGGDNTFVTFYQLKRKIDVIFADDWTRNERDLFAENIEMFGGADFQLRFSESSEPTATFLTTLDRLAADVASKAYLSGTGPFEGWSEPSADPTKLDQPDDEYRQAIARLYRSVLYRAPTDQELDRAWDLMRKINSDGDDLSGGDFALAFDVTVRGDAEVATERSLTIDVRNKRLGVHEQKINQRGDLYPWVMHQRLGDTFNFRAAGEGQSLILTNLQSEGTVSFAGVRIVGPLPGRSSRVIQADDPAIVLAGPWRFRAFRGLQILDDQNQNKGGCSVELPIEVEADGEYEVFLRYVRPPKQEMSRAVLTRVYSHDESSLIARPLPELPPAGEAHFFVDETIDNVAFVDLKTSFRFENEEHYLEVNNSGTKKQVTADAAKFVPRGGGKTIVVDNPDALGKENWPIYTQYPFRPYNITGKDAVSDIGKPKEGQWLRYAPATAGEAFDKNTFYQAHFGFPGQVKNETRVPIIVRAAASSPIVRLAFAPNVALGTRVEIDASASYDIQGSDLTYQWNQVGGPRVQIDDATAPAISFTAEPMAGRQAMWEGLARALVRHPDFLFTRPVSLDHKIARTDGRRLRLVKIAQDLVGRPPSEAEIARLASGESFESLIDRYLNTDEFRDFYFHRVRLYLESHGSDEEDEATRLWAYVAFNDRPFKEIITADYTVDTDMNRAERPAYHGRTGLLTMKGFIEGKQGLPHFNYAAQVAEKFLGRVFEVPAEIVEQREGITAAATTSPGSVCYSCHKILTPLAYQRLAWDDSGQFRRHDSRGLLIDDSDQDLVPTYAFAGKGMEAFALAACEKEDFIRTIINTHFNFFFGREMRWEDDERGLYRRLWDTAHATNFSINALIKAMMTSPEYMGAPFDRVAPEAAPRAAPAKEIAADASP